MAEAHKGEVNCKSGLEMPLKCGQRQVTEWNNAIWDGVHTQVKG